jgi:hypothetical protein
MGEIPSELCKINVNYVITQMYKRYALNILEN